MVDFFSQELRRIILDEIVRDCMREWVTSVEEVRAIADEYHYPLTRKEARAILRKCRYKGRYGVL